MRTILLISAVLLIPPAPAFAWVQTCVPGSTPGKQVCLAWAAADMPVGYQIQEAGSDDIPGTAAFDAVVRGFNHWPEAVPGCLCLNYLGKTPHPPDYSGDGDGHNTVGWIESTWPYSHEIIALTTNLFSEANGRITETDMELNGADYTWAVLDAAGCASGSRSVDVENVVTHEAGHFVGLAHSPIQNSAMYFRAGPGECDKRILHADDLEGIHTLYDCSTPVAQCANADDDDVVTNDPSGKGNNNSCGCKTLPDSGWGGSAVGVAAVLVGVGMIRRWRVSRSEIR